MIVVMGIGRRLRIEQLTATLPLLFCLLLVTNCNQGDQLQSFLDQELVPMPNDFIELEP